MNTRILLAAGLMFVSSACLAEDLPANAAATAFTWNGFYIGAEAGGAWQRDALVETQIGNPTYAHPETSRMSSAFGGAFAGYNFQASSLVFGVEANIDGMNLNNTTLYSNSAIATFGSQTQWQAAIRGRAGFALDRALIYATGGVAFADIDHTYTYGPKSETIGSIRTGWTVGGGIDFALTDHWMARAEYRYTDFGHKVDQPSFAWSGYPESHDETQNDVHFGVGYKF
jgi:outer membrane immunogenic protein